MTRLPPTTDSDAEAYSVVDDLSGDGRVVRARLAGRDVVVRRDARAGSDELAAELGVLAGVEHPGLSRWVDHGRSADGGAWLAREWVEGVDLADWARDRSDAEIGAQVARLAIAVDALHEAGFVHADLKPENVIVGEDGRPVLTDFGLARSTDDPAGAVSGTLFAVAPEVLLGAAPGPAADVFALGVLAHRLWVGRRATARDFYAAFPRRSFFEASGTAPEDLPEWARDVVAAMLRRDPEARIVAADVARVLSARLGLEVAEDLVARTRPRWTVRRGREEWLERTAGAAVAGDRVWVRVLGGEARALASALALDLGAAGSAVQCVDVARECAELQGATALDRWAARRARGGAATVAFLAGESPWARRGAQHLARAVQAAGGGVVVLAEGGDTPSGWPDDAAPDPSAAALAEFLAEALPSEPDERRAELADRLGRDAGAARIDAALERAVATGLLLPAESGWRLRPGRLPAVDPGPASVDGLSDDARAMLLANHVRPDSGAAQARLDGLDPARRRAAASELVRAGLARRPDDGSGRLSHVAVPRDLGDGDRGRLVGMLRHEAARGADESAARVRGWAAGDVPTEHVEADLAELLAAGRPERALELLAEAERLARLVGRTLPAALRFQRGRQRTAIGEVEPVRAEADALERAANLELAERLRGHAAMAAHDFARAEEHFAAAAAAGGREARAHATYARVRSAFEERRHREVVDAVDAVEGDASFPPRLLANLRTLRAMSELHSGNAARARELLARELDDARAAGDVGREAALLLNLATLERRTGDAERALADFERSAELHDRAGLLSGLAQARGQLGGVLRELGRTAGAEEALRAAVELRERLGDRGGAVAGRGMLGLALFDRGHLRAALSELDRAARGLRDLGRPGDAELFEACAELARTRIGHAPRPERGDRADDPRGSLWRARAAWLRGETERAETLAVHARHRAESLGQGAPAAEARLLLAAIAGHEAPDEVVARAGAPARDELELRRWLASAERDADTGRALARRLDEAGRDAAAARAWFALAADGDGEAGERAGTLFARCAAGLGRSEEATFALRLLGAPDPRPTDLETGEPDEEDDMDILSLLDINHQLLEQQDVDPLLGTIVEKALQVSGAERGFLVLEEDGCLRLDRALDTSRGELDQPDVEISGSIVQRALDDMRPVLVSDALDDPLLSSAPSVANLELRSVLCAPFQVHEGLRGAIWVDHRVRTGAFTERDQRVLGLLADQAGLAILQVVRLEEIRRLNERLQRKVVRRESDLRAARRALEAARIAVPASGLVGSSAAMQAVHAAIARAAPTSLPVLVVGESGTGKELAARALHAGGVRSQGPLVVENCAALPPSLIESELFGYRRGAFTGAEDDRPGLFERADGGTLFLDEIGELQPELQAKLLRVLETGEVRRIGDAEARRVDVRLVCATNRDLEKEVRESRFRADLFYRLDGLRIRMPSLAERTSDIPELVEHFLRLEEARGGPVRTATSAVLARLARRPWPGNVRELQNEVARLCVLAEGDLGEPDHVRPPGPVADASGHRSDRVLPMAQVEREAILQALEATGGDKRQAAELLGISRAKIYQRLKAWAEEGENGDAADDGTGVPA